MTVMQLLTMLLLIVKLRIALMGLYALYASTHGLSFIGKMRTVMASILKTSRDGESTRTNTLNSLSV